MTFERLKCCAVPLPPIDPGPPLPPDTGTTNIGRDPLGALSPKYRLDLLVASVRKIQKVIPTGSLIDTTFGPNVQVLRPVFDSGITNIHRAHLLNATCVNNNRCWAGDKLNGYNLARIESEAKNPNSNLSRLLCQQAQIVLQWQQAYANIRFLISPLLEHQVTAAAVAAMRNTLAGCAPSLSFVDSPRNGANYAKVPGTLLEKHGVFTADWASNDGSSAVDIDIEAWRSSVGPPPNIGLIWATCDNGRYPDEDNPPRPDLRKGFPTADQFDHLAALELLPTVRPPFAQCPSAAPLQKPRLWKPWAEDKGTGDPRANKPLLILPTQTSQINLFSPTGTVVATMKYYGPYSGGGFRYYSGTGSNLTAYQMYQQSEWLYFREGNSCFYVNPLRRSGYFR